MTRADKIILIGESFAKGMAAVDSPKEEPKLQKRI